MQGDATPRERLEPSTAEITRRLIDVIGRKLTAYIGKVNDVRAVERWAGGEAISDEVFVRLQFALQIVQTPLHGYGILLRIGQISDRALLIEQGALYQIHREDRCWSAQSIRISQNKLAICFGQSGC